MALRSGFRAQIGHLDDGPMWVNGKTADLAKKIKPLRDAPGRSQVAYQVAGANSGPLKSCFYSLLGLGGSYKCAIARLYIPPRGGKDLLGVLLQWCYEGYDALGPHEQW